MEKTSALEKTVREVLFGRGQARRFTQDSPVLPDVWLEYAKAAGEPVDLLLTPHEDSSAADLASKLREAMGAESRNARIAPNKAYVVVSLTFDQLITRALPLTRWWNNYVWKGWEQEAQNPEFEATLADLIGKAESESPDAKEADESRKDTKTSDLVQMARMVGLIKLLGDDKKKGARSKKKPAPQEIANAVFGLVRGVDPLVKTDQYCLWTVSRNRPLEQTVWRSSLAVKADAARQLFNIKCSGLLWAVVDCGVDAEHPAFRRFDKDGKAYPFPFSETEKCESALKKNTRVQKTYDFTRLRRLYDPGDKLHEKDDATRSALKDLDVAMASGRSVDWEQIVPMLEIPHKCGEYKPPKIVHGTHVAGILAGNWCAKSAQDDQQPEEHDLIGVCPDLELYDFRVFNDQGQGDEFSILAALQFARYLNAHKDQPVIHGVNLSISLRHDMRNYACGRTPICEECERLVNSGIVVVAAAGNRGVSDPGGETEAADEYHAISITDPGNAESVITVGATHRYKPHTYGVSYFSSRGPTGDGRSKPDLVAPGEKILSTIPGAVSKTLDGTSMAAPHVSGAAALLMARHLELVGNPARVKEVLCATATNLNRERNFQGHGMLDVLRALQAV